MKNIAKLILLITPVAGFADYHYNPPRSTVVPEIDGGAAANAVAIIAGGVLLLQSRRKR